MGWIARPILKEGEILLVDNIERLCAEKKISICALEREIKIGNGTIGKWRNPERSPKLENVKRIADYFGVTVDELLSEDQTKN